MKTGGDKGAERQNPNCPLFPSQKATESHPLQVLPQARLEQHHQVLERGAACSLWDVRQAHQNSQDPTTASERLAAEQAL
jgi:hypothetical protein